MDLFSREHRGAIACRLAVIVAGVGVLLAQGPWRDAAWPVHAGRTALLALAVNQLTLVLTATRFHRVLSANHLHTPWRAIFAIHLQSMFYFFFVPMTVGLELSRFAKLKRLHPGVPNTALGATILLDRFVGVAGALVFTALSLPWVALHEHTAVTLGWQRALALAGAGIVAFLALLAWPRARHQLLEAWRVVAPNCHRLGPAALLTALSQAAFAYAVQQSAAAFGIDIGFAATLFAVSASMLFIVLPVSFAGAGPSEAACAALFAMLGLPAREALIASGLVYGLRLVAALQGAAVEIVSDLRSLHRLTPARNIGEHG